ncbi:MAG: hypothetical protein ACRD1K_02060 [Acidimicrobiales bacterium]
MVVGLVRLGRTFWAGANPRDLSAEGGARATEGGIELVTPRPVLVDAQVQVPAPAGQAGGDVEEPVAQRGRLSLANAPVRQTFAVYANRSWAMPTGAAAAIAPQPVASSMSSA